MKNFINHIFDTKNYKWIKKGTINIATFKMIDTYYIHFDSIGSDAYNLYFYYEDLEGNKVFDLINNIDNRSFKVLSNVKNCINDFMKTNEVVFLGYSSYNSERENLYMLMLQNIKRENDEYDIKNDEKKKYYFLYNKSIKGLELEHYKEKFTLNDTKNKK
jgi:hypothetical protein